ncbi:class I glutamine amidotransferase-like protein [Cantharellus anzutake]|uniref:class I glutamine amidotransferase-like protein n=1 Tax=Cantharellus anzutake TaxID=1750568 RepID=UPI001907EA47|nr:class I glutamine amidotransferase-like protein [Cantharellus anzutake]KAF8339890.1 class I glutamine amidotransferase-like protein [Cantharellus anzutake]
MGASANSEFHRYRHASIPTAINTLKTHGLNYNVTFDSTEDQTQFTGPNLANYDAILFLSTTDSDNNPRQEILDADEKAAFQQYLTLGGNYIGVHSSSDSLTASPFFGNETGAVFDSHATLQNATILVINSSNPSTSSLPAHWPVYDEIYNFKSDPRSLGAFVLLSVNESSYTPDPPKFDQGSPHPIAWGQEHGAGAFVGVASPPITSKVGRSWYTSLGHTSEIWENDLFIQHVMGGITWALASHTTRAFNSTSSVGNGGGVGSSTTTGTTTGTKSATSPSNRSSGSARRNLSRWWRLEF